MKPVEKVINHVNAFDKIVYFCTIEEEEFYKEIRKYCDENNVFFHEWDYASGLSGKDIYSLSVDQNTIRDPENALELVNRRSENLKNRSIYIFRDLHFFLNEEKQDKSTIGTIAELKKFALMKQEEEKSTIILLSSKFIIPKELSQYITLIEATYTDVNIDNAVKPFENNYKTILGDKIYSKEWSNIKTLLTGLTTVEIDRILRNARNKLLDNNDKAVKTLESFIIDEKRKIIKASGVAELIEDDTSIEDVGGLERLIEFLKRKKVILDKFSQAKDLRINTPKGCLIVGMPGCGKSLTAKAAHTLFGYPLLRLDMGMILGKYVGESEKNLRDMLNLAEAISPCILWVDELEKAFAGSDSNSQNSDVMRRMMGHFLTWLQEKKSKTFVIATANSVDGIPEELLRKGRFDRLFYVDYPNLNERASIFYKQIKKMGLSMKIKIGENELLKKRIREYKDLIDEEKRKNRKTKFDNVSFSNLETKIVIEGRKTFLNIKLDKRIERKIYEEYEFITISKICEKGMDNFSGAEIEGIIQDAAEEAFYQKALNKKRKINTIEITESSITKIRDNMKKNIDKSHNEKIKHLIELGFENASMT